MADALILQPDREFIADVMRGSGADMKKCFQCATCTAVCELATKTRPFPRKQILEAQWGLSDRLKADPAIWLCHECGECTTRCPRGSRPGDTMGAIRMAVIKRLAFPRFMGVIAGAPGTGALLVVFSALLLLAAAVVPTHGPLVRPIVFAAMFPKSRLEPLFFAVSAFVLLALVLGAIRLVRALRCFGANGPILSAVLPALLEVVRHRRFADCDSNESRRWGHLLALLGFVGLALMGTIVGIGSMIGVIDTPLPMLHPLKIFANLCALTLTAGAAALLWNRYGDARKRAGSSYGDWFFLSLLGGAAFTGILSEALRLMQTPTWMFIVYFIHLTLVLTLFLCTPYSKFAHFLYRTIAMAATWEEQKLSGRGLGAGGGNANSPEGPGLHPVTS